MPPTGHSTEYTGGGGGGGAPSGLGFTAISGLERDVPGQAVTPGWTVVGDYFYISGKVKLELVLLPSNTAISTRGRLVLASSGAQVAGSVTGTVGPGVTADTRVMTGDFSAALTANTLYQIQVEATGGATQSDFATVRSIRVLES